jgi:hypothetical protein
MAIVDKNMLLRGIRGAIGKEIVIKQYGKKTVVTRYPDMTGIKPSKLQKKGRKKFAEAVAFAKAVINDPGRKTAYERKVKRGQTVYHYALKEYLGK